MIGIALLGAGIFAREQHLPAIQSNPAFSLKAIYSRSQASASALASHAAGSLDVYYDTPATTQAKDLAALLARADIHAVFIALPILAQPAVIRQALEAGKHVLSEKPVAADLEAARGLVGWYESLGLGSNAGGKPLWAVAENYRYIESLEYAASEVGRVGGGLATFSMTKNGMVRKGGKYFETEWRKVPEYQGGFLLDGGVHFVAALRMLLAGAGHEIRKVAAFSGLLEEHLPPVDTVSAVAVTGEGKSGTIHISFGTEFKSGFEIEVVTTEGAVLWTPTKVRTVKRGKEEGKEEVVEKEFASTTGVKEEAVAFGEAVGRGKVDGKQSPGEALKDLEILQRLLESGEGGAAVREVGA